jgi:hypothetical protein
VNPSGRDLRAVVRALDALTTQVRRLADEQSTPVVRVGDGVRTTADDRPRIGRPVALATPCGYCGHPYNWHASSGACEVGNEESRCGCDTFTVGERPEPIDPRRILGAAAPAADEDALRATRRESARIILDRATRGIALRSDEAALLRQHFEAETREHDTARAVAAGNKRHVQVMYAELEQAQADRDGAYRERAQLLALLASLCPSVIAPAPDVDEPGWQILYLRIGGKQASWHIAPRDADLVAHVEHVPVDDSRAQWDGHTTEEKYAHIGEHAARLYAEARGRVETSPPAALDGTEQPTTEA